MGLIDRAENLIEDGELRQACEFIENNAEEIGNVGCNYLLGRIYNIADNYSEAAIYLNNALQGRAFDKVIYAELADVYEKLDQFADSECAYEKLLEMENDPTNKWSIYVALSEFYKRHGMWAKLEKIGNKLMKIYSNNYIGFHNLLEASLGREKIVQSEMILKSVPKIFQQNVAYIIDMIAFYEMQDKYDELNSLLDQYLNILGENFVLRKKTKIYIYKKQYDKAEDSIYRLAVDHGDIESLISLIILLISKEKNEEAVLVGEYLLKNIEKSDLYYIYLTKVVTIMGRYRLYVTNKSVDLNQIKVELDDLINFINEYLFYDENTMKFWTDFREKIKQN